MRYLKLSAYDGDDPEIGKKIKDVTFKFFPGEWVNLNYTYKHAKDGTYWQVVRTSDRFLDLDNRRINNHHDTLMVPLDLVNGLCRPVSKEEAESRHLGWGAR